MERCTRAPQRYGQYMEDVQADASVLGIDVESMGEPSILEYVTDPYKEIVNCNSKKNLKMNNILKTKQ